MDRTGSIELSAKSNLNQIKDGEGIHQKRIQSKNGKDHQGKVQPQL